MQLNIKVNKPKGYIPPPVKPVCNCIVCGSVLMEGNHKQAYCPKCKVSYANEKVYEMNKTKIDAYKKSLFDNAIKKL